MGSAGGSGRLAALAAAAAAGAHSHLLPPPPRQVGCARCVRTSTHPRARSAAAREARRWDAAGCSKAPRPSSGRLQAGGLQTGGQAAAAAAAPGDAAALTRRSAGREAVGARHGGDPAGSAALRLLPLRWRRSGASCLCDRAETIPVLYSRACICVHAASAVRKAERRSAARGAVKRFYSQNAEPSFHRGS